MAALPGVTRAQLNTTTGKLIVEGSADLEAIRREGRAEGYSIAREGEEGGIDAANARAGAERLRVTLSGIALLSAYLASLVGAAPWAPIALYCVAIVSGGWGNARKAWHALPRLNFNMSVLMTIAVLGAALIGEWAEGAVVAFLYATSELLEAWSLERSRRSIRELMDLAPKVARVRRGGEEKELPVAEIEVGDVMLLRPGERIAMDGRIIKGESAVDEAPITGEAIPVEKGPGAEVFAGAFNTYGALEVEVTRRAEDTTLAKVIQLVEEAEAKRAPSQSFVDRFAAVYTPIVLALAAGIALLPPLLFATTWGPWIYRGLALLVVACPCALVVSTPVAIVSAIGSAARSGVLIKGGVYLEEAGSLNAVAFDKTGTLTRGEPVVTDLFPLEGVEEDELLQLAASLERHSEHPLARAVIKAAEARGLPLREARRFAALPGRGVRGMIDGEAMFIGNLRLLEETGLSSDAVAEQISRLQQEGKSVMAVASADRLLGLLAVADSVRRESAQALSALKRAGIRTTVLLTGDNERTARAVADQVGVDEYRAELLPEEKASALRRLLERYGKVAMVGDGINDAPALATATVGIAMGGAGTDTALETADIVLMADDLSKLPYTIRLSRAALRVIKQNIAFSLGVKLLALLAVFPGWLNLWLAILADMGASILVTLNGMRLLRHKPERTE